ncbi:LysR family transcriptional regulator [Streptacidiphilus sp. EB129]|uniref:LysR family transcriptional regulator n=1 Tax=Streptacidiphilus sp. EB129 TaxID=3156262 RepID=UPI0035146920
MELRHLEYFVAVAEELSFTRAALRLHVVQSGVSAAIKALEHELGAPLLERSSQRVALTDAGAALLPEARATLDAALAARDAVDQVRGGLRGTVRVGTLISVGILDLPALLGRFHATHPAVNIRLRTNPTGSAGLCQALLDGELDVAFLSLAGRPPAGLRVRDLTTIPLVLIVPQDHRLAGQQSVTLNQLAGERFIDFPAGYGNRNVVDRAFAAGGLEREVAIEVVDIQTAAEFVRHGFGIAFVPSFSAPKAADVRVLPVSDPDLRWALSVGTASARRANAAVRALLELTGQYVHVPDDAAPDDAG